MVYTRRMEVGEICFIRCQCDTVIFKWSKGNVQWDFLYQFYWDVSEVYRKCVEFNQFCFINEVSRMVLISHRIPASILKHFGSSLLEWPFLGLPLLYTPSSSWCPATGHFFPQSLCSCCPLFSHIFVPYPSSSFHSTHATSRSVEYTPLSLHLHSLKRPLWTPPPPKLTLIFLLYVYLNDYWNHLSLPY